MILERLHLQNFRNFKDFSLEIPKDGILRILGRNGTGKTNLLESIYILFTSRSFRNRKTLKDCVRLQEDFFHLQAEIDGVRNGMTFSAASMEKSFMIGQEKVKILDFIRGKNILYFSPDETQVFFQSQEVRRALMDRYLSALRIQYLPKLIDYSNLRQKKVRILLSRTSRKKALLEVESNTFRELSEGISEDRRWFIDQMNPLFQEYLGKLNPKIQDSSLKYRKKQIPDQYLEKELLQERVLYGCHKEELEILENGREVRSIFSNGEKKVINLAIHFAFMELLTRETGQPCLVCLDDIESELDRQTLNNIQMILEETKSQVIQTSKMTELASERDILLA